MTTALARLFAMLSLIAGPVTLFTYGWGFILIVEKIGIGWGSLIALAHIVTWASIGFLFDTHQARLQSSERGQ